MHINIVYKFINNTHMKFNRQTFQQTDRIPMGTNCTPLLADIFLNPIALKKAKIVFNFGLSECNKVNRYEVEFILGLLKSGKKCPAQSFGFTYRNVYNVLSLNNSMIY